MRFAAAFAAFALAASPAWSATFSRAPYGTTKAGQTVEQVTLANDRGMVVKIINYGAIVTDIVVPDARGHKANVALGFGSLADYEAKNGDYAFGAVMGRYAGRIANARFTLGGREIRLVANDGPNALHGGPGGLFTKVWTMAPFRHGRHGRRGASLLQSRRRAGLSGTARHQGHLQPAARQCAAHRLRGAAATSRQCSTSPITAISTSPARVGVGARTPAPALLEPADGIGPGRHPERALPARSRERRSISASRRRSRA